MQSLGLKAIWLLVMLSTLSACTSNNTDKVGEFKRLYEQRLSQKLKTLPSTKTMSAKDDPAQAAALHRSVQQAFQRGDWEAAEQPAAALTALRDHWLGASVSSDAAESACDLALAMRKQGKIEESLRWLQRRTQAMVKEPRWRVAPGMVLLLRQQAETYRAEGDEAGAATATAQAAEWQRLLPPRLAAEFAAHGLLAHPN